MKKYGLMLVAIGVILFILYPAKKIRSGIELKETKQYRRDSASNRIQKNRPIEVIGVSDKNSDSLQPSETAESTINGYFTKARKLAESDQNEAIAFVDSLEIDKETRKNLYSEISFVWAKRDPTACFVWANTFKDSYFSSSILIAATSSCVMSNRPLAVSANLINSIPSGQNKDMVLECTIEAIAQKDLNLAIRLASTASSEDAIHGIGQVLATLILGNGDLGSAKKVIEGLPYGTMRNVIATSLIQEMAAKDPEQTYNWCKDNPEYLDIKSLGVIASAYGNKNPLRGIELADTIGDKQDKDIYLKRLVFSWTNQDPEAAGEWMVRQIEGENYISNKSVFDKIISESIDKDQKMIFDQISKIRDLEERRIVTLNAVKTLSEYNPQKAADTIMTIADTSIRQDADQIAAVKILTSNWLARDPMAASQWIVSLPTGSIRDTGISELVVNILKQDKDSASALKWAQTIQSKDQRERVIKMIDAIK